MPINRLISENDDQSMREDFGAFNMIDFHSVAVVFCCFGLFVCLFFDFHKEEEEDEEEEEKNTTSCSVDRRCTIQKVCGS